ncbi:hypothetical protein V9T40_001184 [Parthenolecanium corni]|uniref:Acyltransferase n=1 Tax=Parthenolecanium corni TaxID=536013 RepID=A0AAN9Y2C5_9HEMI
MKAEWLKFPKNQDAKKFGHFAKISIKKLMNEDWVAMAVLSFFMGLYFWTMVFTICIPLLMFFKPQIGMWFLLFPCWAYYDRKTPRTGGRKSKWLCNLKVFNSLRDYFPINLIKTADLPEGRNYILAHYPHSMIPFNILPNFLNNCYKGAYNFPGIEMQYVTSDMIFIIPIVRDFILALGGCSCFESSFIHLLKSKPSKGIIVVPGGASEIQYTKPGSIYTIIRRKGFVRLALATGTPIVPVFTFGEINTWTKLFIISIGEPVRSIVRRIFKCPVDVPIPLGRVLLPKKIPVNTVVGAPILVPKAENPSKELIDEYYNMFYRALQDLFEKYKYDHDIAGGKAKLIMV